jgi:hypothetical protein
VSKRQLLVFTIQNQIPTAALDHFRLKTLLLIWFCSIFRTILFGNLSLWINGALQLKRSQLPEFQLEAGSPFAATE